MMVSLKISTSLFWPKSLRKHRILSLGNDKLDCIPVLTDTAQTIVLNNHTLPLHVLCHDSDLNF